ncbi:penicillin-binding protein 1C [uncultured Dokdonia sp.]|uniref:penicillin-binding protein 1C n=1 Tax=uncultured Dokdonia sp. TaxID=575653 RepID=UPI00261390E5|nr:penicillin-binding protein 1C [uncultured Dokdonia sp.]
MTKLRKHKIKLSVFVLVFLYWLFCLPSTLFKDPTSTVVESSTGELLGARIADDGQWRFPALDSVPYRFEQSLLLFEDEYFYTHPGFNPVAMGKAIYGNMTTDKRRGGSTLTQQVIRLSRKNSKRTYIEKLLELVKATRLETQYSKDEILAMYATYAPFGGNVVGLETAAWRYFRLPAHQLSWGQSAALAVLPNNPSMVRPGKNERTLSRKRNQLLEKLWKKGIIDESTYRLALLEELPGKPYPLPQTAPHLTERIRKEHKGKRVKTTIQSNVQRELNRLAQEHHLQLQQNEIYNLAIVVMDVTTKTVIGYVGNAPTIAMHQKDVDIVMRPRSTGSILKPLLYAGMLDAGDILPENLVIDIPTYINGYQPQNFNKEFQGVVPVSTALARSLNVPAVRMLRRYGLDKFYNNLQEMEVAHIDKSASYYGLSLILGGAESSLWEVTKTYAGLAHTLNTYTTTSSEYTKTAFQGYSYTPQTPNADPDLFANSPIFDAGAIYNTLETLREVNRPSGEENWQFYEDAQPIAWKTGTSYGFKDAWAVGVTPQYAIGVWVGNADGEGRPGVTGIQAAAPLFFDVLRTLPNEGTWFSKPYDALIEVIVCSKSGALASVYCPQTKTILTPDAGIHNASCSYHKQIYVTNSGSYRVNSDCYELDQMKSEVRFVLPPAIAYYYASKHPDYRELPPMHPDCDILGEQPMSFIYPKKNEDIILPKDFDGKRNDLILKLAHRNPDTKVFWYLNDTFIGDTETFHELAVLPEEGDYIITVVDAEGNQLKQQIKISKS